jgi:O-acetyl-ADP-ribose deacetylase (regulator of RNase III)
MDVAIKILKPGTSPHRFLREARILAQLKSPYIVRVHDFEILDDDVPMLVMEWVEGNDLHQMMEDFGGRVSEQYVLPWMRDVCEGMKVAAGEGIIHRDLKPSNILLDSRNHARVADFGLARDPAKRAEMSAPGQLLGTAYYMAPEQAEDPRGVDTRADIYSFGATFYHALTGTPPFSGETIFSILFKHKTEPLISPKARFPAISERLNAILERCLAKSPTDRFQSFATLLRQLEAPAEESSPWDATDEEDLAVYLSQYGARRHIYFRFPRSTDLCDVYDFPGGRTIRILVGDVVSQKVDALVSSDDESLRMGGGVSAAIRNASAGPIWSDARRFAPVRPGRAIVTSAGALTARFVFHGITTGYRGDRFLRPSPDLISEILASCFYHADTFNVTSIAFPLLGTGAAGFPHDVCLDTMFRCLARTFLRGMTCVRDARIVLLPGNAQFVSLDASDVPQHVPEISGYSFYHYFVPSGRFYGDIYDYIPLTTGQFAVIAGEVPGVGLETQDLAKHLLAALKRFLKLEQTPARVMDRVNGWMLQTNAASHRFVTMVLAVLDPKLHRVTFVNAGHLPPMMRRSDKGVRSVERLDFGDSGLPLGVTANDYQQATYSLGPGDLILLYTDGVSEAMNERNELYGWTRLRQALQQAESGAKAAGESIATGVSQFIGTRPVRDDQLVIVFGRD